MSFTLVMHACASSGEQVAITAPTTSLVVTTTEVAPPTMTAAVPVPTTTKTPATTTTEAPALTDEELLENLIQILSDAFFETGHDVYITDIPAFEIVDTSQMTNEELDKYAKDELVMKRYVYMHRSSMGLDGDSMFFAPREEQVIESSPTTIFRGVKALRRTGMGGMEFAFGNVFLGIGDIIVLFDLEADNNVTWHEESIVPTFAIVSPDGVVKHFDVVLQYEPDVLFSYWNDMLNKYLGIGD